MKKPLSFILVLILLIGIMPMTALANANEESEENPWNGRSAVFVGDSITAGSGTTDIYYQFLNQTLGFGSVTGMGVAGSCISAASDYGQSNQPLINRYQNIPSADLIVIFMGTNDYGHETPLGSAEDTQDGSFYGALNEIIPALVAKHSSSKIVFVTPLHRYGFGTSKILGTKFTYDNIPNGVGATLEDYVDALKTVCEKNGVSVIDLYTECTLDPADSSVRSRYMPDGLHPNAAGHELIAEIMESHIRRFEPEEQEPIELTEMVYGNRFATGNNQPCRASSRVNYYLKAGTVITLKNPDVMQWACVKTADENSCSNLGYFPDGGWSDQETAVVGVDGWVGFVFKYRDETQSFDLTKPLSDYITIEIPHTHSYENGICTACGAEHPNMANMKDKVISIMGDSISTFSGYIPTADGFNLAHSTFYPKHDVTSVNTTWWMQTITALNAKLGVNESWSGSYVINTIDGNSGSKGEDAAMASLTRIRNLGSNGTPDMILFFGGTNDIAFGSPLGSFDPATAPDRVDLSATKWTTYADAYVAAVMRMQYYYPNAQILCIFPTENRSYYTAQTRAEYISVMSAICDHYGVSYLDPMTEGFAMDSMLGDVTHPNAKGMNFIADCTVDALLDGYHNGPSIITQPEDVELAFGERFTFNVEAEGEGLTYQWYYKDASMESFAVSSVKSATYSFDMLSFRVGREYYCVITDENGNSVQTDTVKAIVPVTVTEQPQNAQAEIGENFSITVGAVGEGLTYQWYYKDSGSSEFLPSCFTGTSYSRSMESFCDGREVYCVITDKYGNTVTTDTAFISRPLTITNQPQDAITEIGDHINITVEAQGEGLSYQWYYKEKNASDFSLSVFTGTSYSRSMESFCDGREVYCVITDKYGNTITTDTVGMYTPEN